MVALSQLLAVAHHSKHGNHREGRDPVHPTAATAAIYPTSTASTVDAREEAQNQRDEWWLRSRIGLHELEAAFGSRDAVEAAVPASLLSQLSNLPVREAEARGGGNVGVGVGVDGGAAVGDDGGSGGGAAESEQTTPALASQLLRELGPVMGDAIVLRQMLSHAARLDESTVAQCIGLVAMRAESREQADPTALYGVYEALRATILSSPDPSANDNDLETELKQLSSCKISTLVQAVQELRPKLDWSRVFQCLDSPEVQIRTPVGFAACTEAHMLATGRPMSASLLVGHWRNVPTQYSLLAAAMSRGGSVIELGELSEHSVARPSWLQDSTRDPVIASKLPIWECVPLVQTLLDLHGELPYDCRATEKALFEAMFRQLPDTLALAVASAQTHDVEFQQVILSVLLRTSRRTMPHFTALLRRLWELRPALVAAAFADMWREPGGVSNVPMVLQFVQELGVLSSFLNLARPYAFALDVAVLASYREYVNIDKWLTDRIAERGVPFLEACVAYLRTQLERPSSSIAVEETASIFRCLKVCIENGTMPPELVDDLTNVYKAYTERRRESSDQASSVSGSGGNAPHTEAGVRAKGDFDGGNSFRPEMLDWVGARGDAGANAGGADATADSQFREIDNEANSYFSQVYRGEMSVEYIIELLLRLKASPSARDQRLFECMIHNLVNEYQHIAKYPERELQITGRLFGELVRHRVFSDVETLKLALWCVCDALFKPPPSRLTMFGLCALERFKERLSEWPMYSTQLLRIPHLSTSAPELVAYIESFLRSGAGPAGGAPLRDPAAANAANAAASAASGAPPSTSTTAGGTDAAAAPSQPQAQAAAEAVLQPDEMTKDKIHFIFNNLTEQNMDAKAQELAEVIRQEHVPYLSVYIVERRAAIEPNFHDSYIGVLERMARRTPRLPVLVLAKSYERARALLASDRIRNSSSERSTLKNLGTWIGNLTLARNKPILAKDIDLKELIFTAYSDGRLVAVVPFVCKVLQSTAKSKVFRPPNPWVTAILGVLRELFYVPELKMNLKFEVELLCKNISVDLKEIAATDVLKDKRQPSKVDNPDFTLKKSQGAAPGLQTTGTASSASQTPTRPTAPATPGSTTGALPAASTPSWSPHAPPGGQSATMEKVNPATSVAAPAVSSTANSAVEPLPVPASGGGRRELTFPLSASSSSSHTMATSTPSSSILPREALLSAGAAVATAPTTLSSIGQPGPSKRSTSVVPPAVSGLKAPTLPPSMSPLMAAKGGAGFGGGVGASAMPAQLSAPLRQPHAPPGGVPTPAPPNVTPSAGAIAGGTASTSTAIPDLAQHITVNPSIALFQTLPQLKRLLPVAVDRALQEIIQPVVARSCTIASITTRELILKDFARESDANKIRQAAHQMVEYLAGALALVTCKEPLRVSISNQLSRLLSQSVLDQSVLEQTVQIVTAENLEVCCRIIQSAAIQKAAKDIDNELAHPLQQRRQTQSSSAGVGGANFGHDGDMFGSSLSSPSMTASAAAAAAASATLPGGRGRPLRVYDDFMNLFRVSGSASQSMVPPAAISGPQSPSRSALLPTGPALLARQPSPFNLGSNSGGGGGGGGGVATGVGGNGISTAGGGAAAAAMAQHASIPPPPSSPPSSAVSAAAAAAAAAAARGVVPVGPSVKLRGAAQGYAMLSQDSVFSGPLSVAGSSAPTSVSSGGPGDATITTAQVREFFNEVYPELLMEVKAVVAKQREVSLAELPATTTVQRLWPQISSCVRRAPNADEAAIVVAQKVFQRLYDGDSRLHREVHVAVLDSLRESTRRLPRELVTWLSYLDEGQKFDVECTLALMRPGTLLSMEEYDVYLAKTIDMSRNTAALSFGAQLVSKALVAEPLATPGELFNTLEVLAKFGSKANPPRLAVAPDGLVALVASVRKHAMRAPTMTPSTTGSTAAAASSSSGTSLPAAMPAPHAVALTSPPLTADEATEYRQRVVNVLDEWASLCASGGNAVGDARGEAFVAQFVREWLSSAEATERFMHEAMDVSWEYALRASPKRIGTALSGGVGGWDGGGSGADGPADSASGGGGASSSSGDVATPYARVDMLALLIVAACNASNVNGLEISKSKRLLVLQVSLAAIVRHLRTTAFSGAAPSNGVEVPSDGRGAEHGKAALDLRPHFRLLSDVFTELAHRAKREDVATPGDFGAAGGGGDSSSTVSPTVSAGKVSLRTPEVLGFVFDSLESVRPAVVPVFAFDWLALISHKKLLPHLLGERDGEHGGERAAASPSSPFARQWAMFERLLLHALSFLAPFLRFQRLTDGVRVLYKGVLRLLLVLLHDFPNFLCAYHFSLCDVIPANCVQLRNLVLSAFPRSMRLPDPFSSELKVEELPEMATPPVVLSDYTSALERNDLRWTVDDFLRARSPASMLLDLRSQLQLPASEAAAMAAASSPSSPPDHPGGGGGGGGGTAGTRYNIPAINALVFYVGQHAMERGAGAGGGQAALARTPHMELFEHLVSDLDAEGRYHFLNTMVNQLRFPNYHTHYFSSVLLYLFADAKKEIVQEQIARVLVERYLANRPHPWGLLVTIIKLIKNSRYNFWSHSFVRCAPEIERLFKNVAQSCMRPSPPVMRSHRDESGGLSALA